MRTNKKDILLEAAITIVENNGLAALTYDSLSAATGMSKSGIIYHFPTRKAMLLDVNAAIAAIWERQLEEAAGGPAHSVDARTRARAHLEVMSRSATLAALLVTIDTLQEEEARMVWADLQRRWATPADNITDDPAGYLLSVIADGLWVHDHVNGVALTNEQRTLLIEHAWNILSP